MYTGWRILLLPTGRRNDSSPFVYATQEAGGIHPHPTASSFSGDESMLIRNERWEKTRRILQVRSLLRDKSALLGTP